jgi:hypothetical protein
VTNVACVNDQDEIVNEDSTNTNAMYVPVVLGIDEWVPVGLKKVETGVLWW